MNRINAARLDELRQKFPQQKFEDGTCAHTHWIAGPRREMPGGVKELRICIHCPHRLDAFVSGVQPTPGKVFNIDRVAGRHGIRRKA